MIRVLVAPGPFKGALSAPAAAAAIAAGMRLEGPLDIASVPVADGGEGTLDALVSASGGISKFAEVADPLGRPVRAAFGLLPDSTAVVELAQASGYERLTAAERDPAAASSFGTGELLGAALDHGPSRIIVGVGGSATTDGGLGLARALGVRALDGAGRELAGTGADLNRVATIDLGDRDPRLDDVAIEVACDVDNPLCGPDGAARVFGPQKGADAEGVKRLEAGLENLAAVFARDCGADLARRERAGAAGGAAGGLAAMFGARLSPGAPAVLDALGFDARLDGAALCITGEGSLDSQTLAGKGPAEVARRAAAAGVPCVALCGALGLGPRALREAGFAAAFAIGREVRTLGEALAETERDLAAAGASLGGMLRALRASA